MCRSRLEAGGWGDWGGRGLETGEAGDWSLEVGEAGGWGRWILGRLEAESWRVEAGEAGGFTPNPTELLGAPWPGEGGDARGTCGLHLLSSSPPSLPAPQRRAEPRTPQLWGWGRWGRTAPALPIPTPTLGGGRAPPTRLRPLPAARSAASRARLSLRRRPPRSPKGF